MRVVGLDLAVLSSGVALAGRTLTVSPGASKDAERLSRIHRAMLRLLDAEKPDLVVIEGYSFSRGLAGARSVAEVGGVVRLLLWHLKIPYVEVPPASLKLFATGSGRADKTAMRTAARRAAPIESWANDDEVDAWWLRRVGLAIVGKLSPLEPYQRAALERVHVPDGIRRRVNLARRSA